MVLKVNPTIVPAASRSFIGKTLSTFTVVLGASVAASLGPLGAMQAVLNTIEKRATIVAQGALTLGTTFTVMIEGEWPSDMYNGVAIQTFAVAMAADIVALGTVATVNLIGTTVTAGPVYAAQ
jgi:hypothetical protein